MRGDDPKNEAFLDVFASSCKLAVVPGSLFCMMV